MHKIPWQNPPQEWTPSNAFWTYNLQCSPGKENPPSITDWLQHSEEVWDRAHTHLLHAVRQVHQANRHRRPSPAHTPGQWVWLSTRDLRLRLPCRKLSPRYVGPFKISRQITPVSFRLELPSNYRISLTFHVSLLKLAGDARGETEEGAQPQTPLPFLVDWRGDLQSAWVARLQTPGRYPPVSGWLGVVRSGGAFLGQCRRHPRPYPQWGISQVASRETGPRPRGRPRCRLIFRVRSRSQGEGSVTEEAPIPPPPHHQREPSPEY